jgi:hypothetical protein
MGVLDGMIVVGATAELLVAVAVAPTSMTTAASGKIRFNGLERTQRRSPRSWNIRRPNARDARADLGHLSVASAVQGDFLVNPARALNARIHMDCRCSARMLKFRGYSWFDEHLSEAAFESTERMVTATERQAHTRPRCGPLPGNALRASAVGP